MEPRQPESSVATSVLLVGLLLVSVLGLAFYLVPEDIVLRRAVLVSPDRTTRPLNPVYVTLLRNVIAAVSASVLALVAIISARRPQLLRDLRFLASSLHRGLIESRRYAIEFVRTTPKAYLTALLLLVLAGVALRLKITLERPIGPDEAINWLYFASRSTIDILSDYHIPNNHILHTALVKLSYSLLGINIVAIRLPALLAGFLCILATFWLAHRIFDPATALLSAGFVSLAPPLVEYSADARGYTLMTLLFLIAFIIATYVRERPSVGAWALFVITISLGLFTLPIMVYGAALIAIWLLLSTPRARRKSLVRDLVIVAIATAILSSLLYLPVLVRTGIRYILAHSPHPVSLARFAELLPAVAQDILACWSADHEILLSSSLLTAVTAAVVLPWSKRKAAFLLLISVTLGLALMFPVHRIVPPHRAFHFVFPLFAAIAAMGVHSIFRAAWPTQSENQKPVWALICILLCATWGLATLRKSEYSCIETGFPDAAAIVGDFHSRLNDESVLLARGGSAAIRFNLMAKGYSPRRLHQYVPRRTRHQLDPYRRMFVVLIECAEPRQELALLGFPKSAIDADFEPPRLLHQYSASCVFLLERKAQLPLKESPYPDDPWGFPKLY